MNYYKLFLFSLIFKITLQLNTIWSDSRIEFHQLQADWLGNEIFETIWYPKYDLQRMLFANYLDYDQNSNSITKYYAIKDNDSEIIIYKSYESKPNHISENIFFGHKYEFSMKILH